MDRLILKLYYLNIAYDNLPEPRRFLTFFIPLCLCFSLTAVAKAVNVNPAWAIGLELLVCLSAFLFRYPFVSGIGTQYLKSKKLIN